MEVANAHLFFSNVKTWVYLYYFLACEFNWKELTEKCPNLILYFQKKKKHPPNKQTTTRGFGGHKPTNGHLRERAEVEILNCSLGSNLERASSWLVKIDTQALC